MEVGESEVVAMTVELQQRQAWALAELCKRATYSDVLELAIDSAEAYSMMYALDRLRRALIASGVVR